MGSDHIVMSEQCDLTPFFFAFFIKKLFRNLMKNKEKRFLLPLSGKKLPFFTKVLKSVADS